MAFVVRDVLRDGAVVREACAHSTRLAVGAQVLLEILGPDGIVPVCEGAVEPGEIRLFATQRQRFREIGRHVELMVPAPTTL